MKVREQKTDEQKKGTKEGDRRKQVEKIGGTRGKRKKTG